MRKFLTISLISLCSACAIGPDYQKNEIYSEKQISKELNINNNLNANVSTEWFKLFNDAYLNELINIALKNSPTINIAKEKLYQARHNLYITEADLLPSFDATGEYIKSSPASVVEPMAKQNYYQVGFDASWEIDIWGGKRRLIESQKAIFKSVGANFNNVKLILISEIALNYVNWHLYQKLIDETNITIENQTKIFETTKSKYDAGLVDELTLNQAESLLKSTKQKLTQYIINKKNTLNSLAILIGILPSKIKKSDSSIYDNEISFDLKLLYNLPANVIQTRPDIWAAEQQLIAQNALIGNKISKIFPSLSLSTFLGFQNNTLSPIFAKDYNMYSNNIETILPVLHWGKIINDIKIQRSTTKEAFETYKTSVLQGIINVKNAITSVEENSKNSKLAKENFSLYQNIVELSKQKYENGIIAFSDYVNAEQDKISAQISKYQSLNNLFIGIISFYKAIGGGFQTNYSATDDQKVLTTSVDEPCKG